MLQTLVSGIGILHIILAIAIIVFIIIVIIWTLIAINRLHRLPQIQSSIENIEKYLKVLVAYEKKRVNANQNEEAKFDRESPEEAGRVGGNP
jgi:uncharacterized protein YoxC